MPDSSCTNDSETFDSQRASEPSALHSDHASGFGAGQVAEMFALKHGQGRSVALAGRSAARSGAELGREIRELRHSRGWTLKTLAGMIGVTGAQLHRYETGTTRMTGDRLASLGEALGVDVGSLLGKADESTMSRPMSREPAKLSDDILALVEIFVEITDPKSRNAIVAIARILAAPRTIPEID